MKQTHSWIMWLIVGLVIMIITIVRSCNPNTGIPCTAWRDDSVASNTGPGNEYTHYVHQKGCSGSQGIPGEDNEFCVKSSGFNTWADTYGHTKNNPMHGVCYKASSGW